MINRLGDSLDFQSQALVLRSERQRLLASNIANADTPGYVARDMDFAAALRDATGLLPAGLAAVASLGTAVARRLRRVAPRRICATPRRARATWTATRSTWTASAPPSPTTR